MEQVRVETERQRRTMSEAALERAAGETDSANLLEGEPSEVFRQREKKFTALAAAARRQRDALSWGRIVVFVLALGCLLAAVFGGEEAAAAGVASAVLLAFFAGLVRMQRQVEGKRAEYVEMVRINADAYHRHQREWQLLPAGDFPFDHAAGPLSRDLNLFGDGSLFQLLGSARTPMGRRLLARWLLNPAPVEEIESRQAAVHELSGRLELRQETERLGSRGQASSEVIEEFIRWAARSPADSGLGWRLTLARTLPIVLAILAIAHAVGLIPPFWIGMIPISAVVWLLSAGYIERELAPLELRAVELSRYEALLRLIRESQFESPHLLRLQDSLNAEGAAAHSWIARLGRIVQLAELRHSPIVYLPLQLALLWNTHVVDLLHRWRGSAGVNVEAWLDTIAEFEALCAVGAVAYENPSWTFPTVDASATRWQAADLGHPLLPDSRVGNDVELGPPGTFLLVTGSNMSGKSTLMRAMGMNIVLAQVGGPICARRMELPPTRLGTSFVIEDSLAQGVSYFFAELQRLKTIVDEAGGGPDRPGSRYLFLLDEILKGTNSGERQIAVRRILLELLESGAAGAISTHDLGLAEVEPLTERSTAVHFKEHFADGPEQPPMTFDYRVRPGLATSSNALALLDLVGIKPREVPPISGDMPRMDPGP